MIGELLLLRLIHILGGVFWVGSVMFTAFFLLPVLGQSGPAAAHVMMGLQRRKMMVVLPIVALLTILSGLRLMMITSTNFSPGYFQTLSGQTYAVSGLAAIVALAVGLVVTRPATVQISQLSHMAASGETDRQRIADEIKRQQRRAGMGSTVVVILVTLAAVGMAVARYL